MRKILLIILAVVIAGCVHMVRNIEITHFQTGQVLQSKYNPINRMVTVVMPDGEILKGKYVRVGKTSFTFRTESTYPDGTTAEGSGRATLSGGKTQAYALLKSETSSLMMEITVAYSGWHGFGEARTNDGRTYKVQF